MKKFVLVLTALLLPLMAETVMRIHLTGEVSDENISSISKIVFSDNMMMAGASYSLDQVQKIDFYDDGNTAIAGKNKDNKSATALTKGQIGFSLTASNLALTLSENANITVSLYSMNGRKVAELYNGNATSGLLNINLANASLATGIYSTVVKANNTLLVRKIVIQ